MPLIAAFSADDDFEDKVADAGRYPLRITSVKLKESQSEKRPGAKYLAFGLAFDGADGFATIWHNLNIPWTDDNPSADGQVDEPRTQRMMLRDVKRFFAVFGIPLDAPLEEEHIEETFVGMTGECNVKKVEAQDRDGNKTGEWRNELSLPPVH